MKQTARFLLILGVLLCSAFQARALPLAPVETMEYGYDSSGNLIHATSYKNYGEPILVPIGDKSLGEGQLLSFPVSVADAGPAVIGASGLPSGATFQNDLFTWTPGYLQSGLHQKRKDETA